MPAGSSDSSLGRAAYRVGRLLARLLGFVERVPPWLVLGALVIVGWAIASEAGRIAPHDGPVYYHGGDGTYYYTSAWMLAHGVLPITSIGYGYPLLLAPIAAVAGPSLIAGLPAIIGFNQLVLAPIALALRLRDRAHSRRARLRVPRDARLGALPGRGHPLLPGRLPRALCRHHAAVRRRAAPARRLPVDGAASRRRVLHAPRRVVRALGRRPGSGLRRRPRRGGEAGEPALPAGADPCASRRPAVPRAGRPRRRDGAVAPRDDRLEAARPRRSPRVREQPATAGSRSPRSRSRWSRPST